MQSTVTVASLRSLNIVSMSMLIVGLVEAIIFREHPAWLIPLLFIGIIGMSAGAAVSSLHKRVLKLEEKCRDAGSRDPS
jgi:hypothetical protein